MDEVMFQHLSLRTEGFNRIYWAAELSMINMDTEAFQFIIEHPANENVWCVARARAEEISIW